MKTKSTYTSARESYHLKLKDLAYILAVDSASLSRFEAGVFQNPKALAGYHTLFNLSIQNSITQVFEHGFKELLARCYELEGIILDKPNTAKNRQRLMGLDAIITRLLTFSKDHE